MTVHKRGPAWKVQSSAVPKQLLDALAEFTDPVEKILPHDQWLFKPLTETFAAPAKQAWDWRSTGALSPPSFQGACNTCTSFAVVAAIEALHFLKAKTRIKLAPGFIHACLLGRSCKDGAGIQEALDAAAAHGIALSFPGDYPYPTANCSTTNLYRVAQRVRISSRNEAMLTLMNHGPIVADMFIDPAFINLPAGATYQFQDTNNGMLHSVCVVGFDQQAQCWIVMNSYGKDWSEGGFGRIAFDSGGLLSTRAGWQAIL